MPRTLPTEPLEWAESAALGDISEPPVGVRAAGYQFEDILPHDEHNAVLRGIYRWLAFLNGGGVVVGDLAEAEALDRNIDDVVTIADSRPPFETVAAFAAPASGDIRGVATWGGKFVYTTASAPANNLFVVDEDGNTEVAVAPGTLLSPTGVAAGEAGIAVIDSTAIEFYNWSGVLQWTYSHGAQIADVAMDHEHVYLVGLSGTNGDGTGTHRAVTIASGAHVWTQAWGATLYSVQATGTAVLVGGSLGTAGYYAGELNRSTGAATRYLTVGAAITAAKGVQTDGVNFWVMTTGGLFRFPYETADATGYTALTGTGFFTLDDKFVYVVLNSATGNIKVYPRNRIDVGANALVTLNPLAGTSVINDLQSNGRRLFIACDEIALSAGEIRVTTGLNKQFQKIADGNFSPLALDWCPINIDY